MNSKRAARMAFAAIFPTHVHLFGGRASRMDKVLAARPDKPSQTSSVAGHSTLSRPHRAVSRCRRARLGRPALAGSYLRTLPFGSCQPERGVVRDYPPTLERSRRHTLKSAAILAKLLSGWCRPALSPLYDSQVSCTNGTHSSIMHLGKGMLNSRRKQVEWSRKSLRAIPQNYGNSDHYAQKGMSPLPPESSPSFCRSSSCLNNRCALSRTWSYDRIVKLWKPEFRMRYDSHCSTFHW